MPVSVKKVMVRFHRPIGLGAFAFGIMSIASGCSLFAEIYGDGLAAGWAHAPLAMLPIFSAACLGMVMYVLAYHNQNPTAPVPDPVKQAAQEMKGATLPSCEVTHPQVFSSVLGAPYAATLMGSPTSGVPPPFSVLAPF